MLHKKIMSKFSSLQILCIILFSFDIELRRFAQIAAIIIIIITRFLLLLILRLHLYLPSIKLFSLIQSDLGFIILLVLGPQEGRVVRFNEGESSVLADVVLYLKKIKT